MQTFHCFSFFLFCDYPQLMLLVFETDKRCYAARFAINCKHYPITVNYSRQQLNQILACEELNQIHVEGKNCKFCNKNYEYAFSVVIICS